jgi:all-trans-retinol 13,14-reductase
MSSVEGVMMKVKNMIYLTISYIPWIVYWTISADLKPYGGVIALILELILVSIQKSRKNYSFMDLFSALYFIVTIIGAYIVKSDTFIIGDGYIGYASLFVMSILSILIEKPFMKYYVKKDFKNQNVISSKIAELTAFQTKVWAAVFFIDIWVFVFIHAAVIAVITSNVFVLIGIILSIYNENTSNNM